MQWHCLSIEGDPDPADAIAALVEFVKREFRTAGSPDSFSVYHDASRPDRPVFYFSPAASSGVCGLECFEALPCPPPAHLEGLSRIV